jgi:dihydroneopterin aldolase
LLFINQRLVFVFRIIYLLERLESQLKMHVNATVTDIIFIEDLRIETIIGVFDWEREITQMVSFDLQMAFDINQAGQTDNIADTLNYQAVSEKLISFVESSNFQLLEALAERCANIVLREFPVNWLRLKLSKPRAVRNSSAVGVIIERRSNTADKIR